MQYIWTDGPIPQKIRMGLILGSLNFYSGIPTNQEIKQTSLKFGKKKPISETIDNFSGLYVLLKQKYQKSTLDTPYHLHGSARLRLFLH